MISTSAVGSGSLKKSPGVEGEPVCEPVRLRRSRSKIGPTRGRS